MARNQKNFDNFLYVDDNAVSWTKRGESGGAATGIDGHATGTGAPTWIDGSRMRARRVIAQDPTTFRTISFLVYTAAAYAAIALGDDVAVQVACRRGRRWCLPTCGPFYCSQSCAAVCEAPPQ